MKKRNLLLVIGLLVFTMLLTVACKKDPAPAEKPNSQVSQANEDKPEADKPEADEPEDEMEEDKAMISDWEGTWNNIQGYFEMEEVQESFEKAAEAEGVSVEEFKEALNERRDTDFGGMVVEGDTIKFYDGFPEEGGKLISEGKYHIEESIEVQHGGSIIHWHVAKTDDDTGYPLMLLMDVHGEDEITHFHMRYGTGSVEDLQKMDNWYPTMVKSDSSIEQVKDEIEG